MLVNLSSSINRFTKILLVSCNENGNPFNKYDVALILPPIFNLYVEISVVPIPILPFAPNIMTSVPVPDQLLLNFKAVLFPAKYILYPWEASTSKEYITFPDADPAMRLAITLFCPAELVGLYTYNEILPSYGFVDVEEYKICNLLVGLVVPIPTLPPL